MEKRALAADIPLRDVTEQAELFVETLELAEE